jgi:hypothetical protein
MTFTVPDFTQLTAAQFVVVLVAVAVLDLATGIIGSVRDKTFSAQKVLDVLETHGIYRILPIGALWAIGAAAAMPALCAVSDALLAAYFVETMQSSWTNLAATPPA